MSAKIRLIRLIDDTVTVVVCRNAFGKLIATGREQMSAKICLVALVNNTVADEVSGDDLFCGAKRREFLLCYKNFTAYRTLLAFRKSYFGTGC